MATLNLKRDHLGEYWQLRWRDENGHSRERTLRIGEYTETQARNALADAQAIERARVQATRASDAANTQSEPTHVTPTVQQVIDEVWRPLMRLTLEGSTLANYDSMINARIPPEFKARPIGDITEYDIEMLLATTSRTHSPATVRKLRNTLSTIWRVARSRKIVESNIAKGAQIPARVGTADPAVDRNKVVPPSAVWALAEAIGPLFRVPVLMMGFAGLRIGEVVALDVGDVDVDRLTVSVTKTESAPTARYSTTGKHHEIKTAKTQASVRTVRVAAELMAEIEPLVEGRRPDEALFTAPRGGRLNSNNLRRRHWRRAVAACGLGDLTPHGLRHTAASFMIGEGLSPPVVAAQLGHANAGVTMSIYAGWWDQDRDDAIAGLGKAITEARDQARQARRDDGSDDAPDKDQ